MAVLAGQPSVIECVPAAVHVQYIVRDLTCIEHPR